MPGDDRRPLRLSIVMPVLDEASTLAGRLDALSGLRAGECGGTGRDRSAGDLRRDDRRDGDPGGNDRSDRDLGVDGRHGVEIVVVDGGSTDGTPDVASTRADRVLIAPRGRATQMNAGARAATGDVLVFLHADTALPPRADLLISEALAHRGWGRFDVRLDSRRMLLRIVGRMMNLRTRLSGIVTGDQTLFVRRELFEAVGGFPEIALMEDIGISARLRRRERPARIRRRVLTSARRWEERGVIRTVVLMWRLRLEYFLGADPDRLAVRYGYRSR